MTEFLLIALVGILALVQVVLVFLFWQNEERFRQKLVGSLGLWDSWRKTQKKSEAILGQAELAGIKIVADTKLFTKQIMATTQQQFGEFLVSLRQESQEEMERRSRVLADEATDAMTAFTKRLEEELTRAQAELADYKKQAMAKTQADLKAVVDQVVKEVVGKGLSLKDQEDLIVEAFEKAKNEKFVR